MEENVYMVDFVISCFKCFFDSSCFVLFVFSVGGGWERELVLLSLGSGFAYLSVLRFFISIR